MTARLPLISHDTALGVICDLLRPVMEDEQADPLTDAVLDCAHENPELHKAVSAMMADSPKEQHMAALIGMAIAYRALRAQAEVEALERMNAA